MTNSALLNLVSKFPCVNLAVVGDLMLDRYIWGKATRISQEAPVPVVLVQKETAVAGGAANVVRNIMSLNAQATAFGILGDDENGRRLQELFSTGNCDTSGIITLNHRPTTVKTRVLAANQQVVRIDQEVTETIEEAIIEDLLNHLQNKITNGSIQALILEDYAKGLLTPQTAQKIVALCQRHHIPVALDPHPRNHLNTKGLYLMTPNRSEAFGLAGMPYSSSNGLPAEKDLPLLEAAKRIRDVWEVENLLITLGKDGMALFRENEQPIHIPTKAREVFDVSGAGDTVMATFMVAMNAGANLYEAMQIANEAAGIVVGKVGTCPVPLNELQEKLEHKE